MRLLRLFFVLGIVAAVSAAAPAAFADELNDEPLANAANADVADEAGNDIPDDETVGDVGDTVPLGLSGDPETDDLSELPDSEGIDEESSASGQETELSSTEGAGHATTEQFNAGDNAKENAEETQPEVEPQAVAQVKEPESQVAQAAAMAKTPVVQSAKANTKVSETSKTTGATTSTAEKTTVAATTKARKYSTPFEAGVYYIQSSLAGMFMLDVSKGSKKDCANVQIYDSNKTDAQRWYLSYDKDGLYSIKCMASGKYLDLAKGSVKNGQNIWQFKGNNTAAQSWIISSNGNGFTLSSVLNKNFVVDVSGGKAKNGRNVQLYKANNTAAQRWWIIPENANPVSEKVIEEGVYEILFSLNESYALDLQNGDYGNGTNIQLYKRNNTVAQRWAFTWEADGYYSVKNVSTAKALDVAIGNPASRTNIWSHESNDTDAQRWAVQKVGKSFTLINKQTGLALDIAGGKAANATNAQMFISTKGASQRLTLLATDVLPNGIFNIYSMISPTSQVLDIPSSSTKAGEVPQAWKRGNGAMHQKFIFTKTGSNTYTIKALNSSKVLEANSSGKVTQQEVKTGEKSQQWVLKFEKTGVVLRNAQTGQPLSMAGNTAKNGAKVQAKKASAISQSFRMTQVELIENGCYIIRNVNGRVLDISDGSYLNSANIQAYDKNGTGAQAFYIEEVGGGYYKIINAKTFKALDVSGGSTADNANIQQFTYNGTPAQLWKPELDDTGHIIFVNKGSGKVLDVAGGGTKNSANVRQVGKNGSASQQWSLTATSYSLSGNSTLDKKIANILSGITAKDKLKAAYNHVVGYSYRSSSFAGGGNWTVGFALDMINRRSGNCYRYAALFQWLAKGLGYNAKAVKGYVPSASGGSAPHGWVEIRSGGKTYICDPDLQYEIPSHNWYWRTYANAPVAYSW